jgi:hypothetical protein
MLFVHRGCCRGLVALLLVTMTCVSAAACAACAAGPGLGLGGKGNGEVGATQCELHHSPASITCCLVMLTVPCVSAAACAACAASTGLGLGSEGNDLLMIRQLVCGPCYPAVTDCTLCFCHCFLCLRCLFWLLHRAGPGWRGRWRGGRLGDGGPGAACGPGPGHSRSSSSSWSRAVCGANTWWVLAGRGARSCRQVQLCLIDVCFVRVCYLSALLWCLSSRMCRLTSGVDPLQLAPFLQACQPPRSGWSAAASSQRSTLLQGSSAAP